MQLVTQEIKRTLPALYATEDVPTDEKKIICKFFTPDGCWTWYVVEGEQLETDFLFFGLVNGLESEWGYFTLEELEAVRGPSGLKIERDRYFRNVTIGDL